MIIFDIYYDYCIVIIMEFVMFIIYMYIVIMVMNGCILFLEKKN